MKAGRIIGAFKIVCTGTYIAQGECLKCGEVAWVSAYKKSWACKNCGYKGGVENKSGLPTKDGEES